MLNRNIFRILITFLSVFLISSAHAMSRRDIEQAGSLQYFAELCKSEGKHLTPKGKAFIKQAKRENQKHFDLAYATEEKGPWTKSDCSKVIPSLYGESGVNTLGFVALEGTTDWDIFQTGFISGAFDRCEIGYAGRSPSGYFIKEGMRAKIKNAIARNRVAFKKGYAAGMKLSIAECLKIASNSNGDIVGYSEAGEH